MGRRGKVAVGAAVGFLALLAVNALLVDGETQKAHVTVAGGRILDLPSGELQVIDRGPREASPIVLLHCFSCAIDWWNAMLPRLQAGHRVIAVDLLGHGGSEKPSSGYNPPTQAKVVAEALERLGARHALVVGHSLGGAVAVALAEAAPRLVDRIAIVDTRPDNSYGEKGLVATLTGEPLIGEALWRLKPDFAIRDGLGSAFAPGFDVPDAFVEDVRRLTYTAYRDSPEGDDEYLAERPLGQRVQATGKPLMVLMGAEDQLIRDPRRALAQYASEDPGVETHLIQGAGHSPNVERPALTARYVREFAKASKKGIESSVRDVTERGPRPQQGSKRSQHRASGVRSATGNQ
jgi:pimeloyl-ACP methyl ester carboxylesterase